MPKITEPNPSQKEAINHKTGPLIVVAGAGTGKTRIITERIKHLITKKGVDADSILALTFTEKAAGEMLNRIADVMPLSYKEPWVCTFHSFADRILKKEGLEIGLDTGYEILNYSKQWYLVRKHLFDFNLKYFLPLGNPTKFISAMLKFVSRLQDEAITEDTFTEFVTKSDFEGEEKQRWQELASFYRTYQKLKLTNSKLDFGDLILWCIRLFDQRPKVLAQYVRQFEHILLDEFQDTNYAQYYLAKMLYPPTRKTGSLMVTGDDSQSIYKFRGAAVSNILDFMDEYKGAKMTTLLTNYRSSQNILDPAYSLIQNNNPDTLEAKLGINKKLLASAASGKVSPGIYAFTTVEEEVGFVVDKIKELIAEHPDMSYKDIAILARANSHLDPFVVALRGENIPYQLIGNRGLYDKDEVKDVIAFLKVLLDPADGVSMFRVLCNPYIPVEPGAISVLLSTAKMRKQPLWDLMLESESKAIKTVVGILDKHKKSITSVTPSTFVYKLANDLGISAALTLKETAENTIKLRNLNLFLNLIKAFETDYHKDTRQTPTIFDYLAYLELMLEAGDNPAQAEIEDIDTIHLSTVHSAKGLEYEAVFMVNLVTGRFPSREKSDVLELPDALVKESLPIGDGHLQEERRLFYVGMTRTKRYLYLTYAKNYGGKRDTAPSGFLAETGIKTVDQKTPAIVTTPQTMFGAGSEYRKESSTKSNYVLDYVSYTQIANYETCPLKYKYGYVLKVPTLPHHSLSFGTSVHNTLREFYQEEIHFNKPIGAARLLDLYEKNWEEAGYLDEAHKKKRFSSGQEILKQYYDLEKDAYKNVLELERTITLKLAGVKFSGRVDRIDRIAGNKVEIIDYKTGRMQEDKGANKNLQIALYAWGVRETLKYEPELLSLYYIEELKKLSAQVAFEDIEKKVHEVEGVVETMKTGDFTPKPGKHCEWCDYNTICPFAYKGA
ncbi:TPA: hypothetical protein DCY43_02155 [candidate division WWE3 bacterium]|uniref:DNA 3'-5' helicase n=1 Tax=candidate division WWE3 bacterium TaxID=2053526 RepID=A0A351JTB4_UNCKA|nr:hypothetical protein [candidate division WWE3 bacterium]